jgi:hypothetical protein
MPDEPKIPEIPGIFQYKPWWQPDPGPPWYWDVVGEEVQIELVASQLQLEKDILAARSAAIDRQLALLKKR